MTDLKFTTNGNFYSDKPFVLRAFFREALITMQGNFGSAFHKPQTNQKYKNPAGRRGIDADAVRNYFSFLCW